LHEYLPGGVRKLGESGEKKRVVRPTNFERGGLMRMKPKILVSFLLAGASQFVYLISAPAELEKSTDVFPRIVRIKPDMRSPFVILNGEEMIVARYGEKHRYTIIPVTQENGKPLLYSRKINSLFGKDRQLEVDSGDFPALARTGLHSDSEVENKKMITGWPVEIINCIGRPGGLSHTGFLTRDEDIVSVLKGDNQLVRQMKLTHPQLAKPLFHIWNALLVEKECKMMGRFSNIRLVYYNGGEITLHAEGTKGWQVSIFQDEIQGRFEIIVRRELSRTEREWLKRKYSALSEAEIAELENKLSSIHFSEMVPFYIMRYGFYEGHTAYRADPVAIAFIFGLRSLEELEKIFPWKLYKILTTHYTR
jgi:hypothetical protein